MDEAARHGRSYLGGIAEVRRRISGDEMSEIFKLFPTALTRLSVADPFLSVAIFCGVGILATLLLLILDPNLFSAWIYP
jgi:hypothetical protein